MNNEHYVLAKRDADWQHLERELAIDPVTFEIVRHKLEAINDEQAIALRNVAASQIVTEAGDFNIGIYMPQGDIVTMGAQVTLHAGCISQVIRNVIADCSENPGIEEGDVFIVNDPFKGAVHHPDMSVVAPIFHDGEIVAWSGATAHLVDVGGLTVGSISCNAVEKYQEGLMLPPIKLVEKGVIRSDIWNMIMNATRQPAMVGLDLKGMIASNIVARRRFDDLVKNYGIDTVKTTMTEMIRYSERLLRERLQELPDGEFEAQGLLDHDGHNNNVYKTHIKLIKSGSNLTFDFSGSSPQTPGFVNCPESTLLGGVFGGLAPVLGYKIPWNHGILNAISIIAPKGLICNAEPPAPTGSATIAEGWVVSNTVVTALSKLMVLHPKFASRAQGVTHGVFTALSIGERNQFGEPFGTQLMDAQLGGGGATTVSDGLDQAGGFLTTIPHIPNVESNELHGPFLYMFRGFLPDTGGAGAYRGGRAAGVAFTPYGVDRIRCAFTCQGVEAPISIGAFGGLPGQTNRQGAVRNIDTVAKLKAEQITITPAPSALPVVMSELGGDFEAMPAKSPEFKLLAGDLWQYTFQGGGGVGDPLLRDLSLVLTDVLKGYVSRQSARDIYGVIIDNDHVDEDATSARREALRRVRISRSEMPAECMDLSSVEGSDKLFSIGPGLNIRAGKPDLIECKCGYVFCDAQHNWKQYAGRFSYDSSDSPFNIVLHESLLLVEYICPECGTLQAVDAQFKNDRPLQDFKLSQSIAHIGMGEANTVEKPERVATDEC